MMFRNSIAAIVAAMAVAGVLGITSPASAGNIIDEWANVKMPPPPALKPVTVDPKTTALLMLDFMNQNCGKRPRCIASIPAMKNLLAAARTAKAMVVYSLIRNTTTADVIKDVAPMQGEPAVLSSPDKFLRTDLEKILKDKGIKTVIVVGTAANGAAIATASHAALAGFNVIAAVDGITSEPFAELYSIWHLAHGPGVSAKVTLTRSDMIKF
jgi:nicotinamidase-related amidase